MEKRLGGKDAKTGSQEWNRVLGGGKPEFDLSVGTDYKKRGQRQAFLVGTRRTRKNECLQGGEPGVNVDEKEVERVKGKERGGGGVALGGVSSQRTKGVVKRCRAVEPGPA